MMNRFWSPKVSFFIISFVTTLLITKTSTTTTMERRNRRRWEEEQEEKTTGWLMMPPGMFFFISVFFTVLPQTNILYTKRPFFYPTCTQLPSLLPIFTPSACFLPHLHSATRLPFPRGKFFIISCTLILTALSRTAYGPFFTPSSLFMYQPPVFCTNRPFFSPTAHFSPHLHSATQATLFKGPK